MIPYLLTYLLTTAFAALLDPALGPRRMRKAVGGGLCRSLSSGRALSGPVGLTSLRAQSSSSSSPGATVARRESCEA